MKQRDGLFQETALAGVKYERQTKTWDKVFVDRERETQTWVSYVRQFLHRGEIVYAYYNNHYGGYGPGSIELFQQLWKGTT